MSDKEKLDEVEKAFRALHQSWLEASSRCDMNKEMDAMAEVLGLDPLTLETKTGSAKDSASP